MADELGLGTAMRQGAQKKQGKFFALGPTYRGGATGLELENRKALVQPPRLILGPTIIGTYGFPEFPETPRLRPAKKFYKRPPRDLEEFEMYWLVSERLKNVLEKIDKDAVVFAECEVYYISGKPIEPRHYLCDIVREIDAVDESSSTLKIEYHQDVKIYDLSGKAIINLNLDAVGSAKVFRLKNTSLVICTAEVRDACVSAGIKDPELFRDISYY